MKLVGVVVYAFDAVESAPMLDYGPVEGGVCKCLRCEWGVHHAFKVVEVAAHPDRAGIGTLVFFVEQECFFKEGPHGCDDRDGRGGPGIFFGEMF